MKFPNSLHFLIAIIHCPFLISTYLQTTTNGKEQMVPQEEKSGI